MAQGFATVKAVLSGDTVVLQGKGAGGVPAPEMQLSLSSLAAPRVSRHPDQKDEPFGWASRDFLRRALIGRAVRFKVDYRVDKIARTFGTLWLAGDGAEASESVNLKVATAGWARVSSGDHAKQGASPEHDALAAAAKAAETAGAGIYSRAGAADGSVAGVRNVVWSVPSTEAASVAAELSARPQPAVVESVVNGTTLRVVLTGSGGGGGGAMLALTVGMAGVQAPRVPAAGAGAAPAAAPPAPAAPVAAPKPAPAPRPAGGVPAAPATAVPWAASRAAAAPPAADASPAPAAAAAAAAGPVAAAAVAAPAAVAAAASPASAEAAIALEARAFTESRLLHRDVVIHVGGADKYGNVFGRVEHPAGDIATELLRAGLARMVDFSIGFTSAGHAGAMRAAERSAKLAQLRLWKDWAPRAVVGEVDYDGRVIEVVSGDTIVVSVPRPGGGPPEERRVSLSSVRAPRMGRRDEKGDPWAPEAKEFLRRALIGRDVHVTVDYTRVMPAPAGGGAGGDGADAAPGPAAAGAPRAFATVTLAAKKGGGGGGGGGGEKVNIAVSLLGEGLAEPSKHRADDDRSPAFDDLLAAEEAARAAKRGMHSSKDAPAHRVTDLSLDAAKAKAHFPFLQRARTLRGMVEYVFAGGRVKLQLPSENCAVVFGIGGLRCPGTAKAASKGPDGKTRPARAADPCGDEALRFMREAVMQQDVEVEVDDVDKKTGVMLGPMWIGRGGARTNLGAELLRRGLAFGIPPVIERVRDAAELMAAEAEAKAAKRGVWEFYVEPTPEEDGDAAEAGGDRAAAPEGSGFRGTVVGIDDASSFYVLADSDRPKLASIDAKLEELLATVGEQSVMLGGDAKKGRVVAVLADDHGSAGGGRRWMRGRLEGKVKTAAGAPALSPEGLELHSVTLVDSGARAEVTAQRMRPLEAPYSTMPALAREATLALVRVPALGADFGADAANLLSDLAFGVPLLVKAHGRDFVTGKASVSLWPSDPASHGESVNEALVGEGLARIASKEAKRIKRRGAAVGAGDKDADLLARLETAQRAAKTGRLAQWRYGDIGESDDEKR